MRSKAYRRLYWPGTARFRGPPPRRASARRSRRDRLSRTFRIVTLPGDGIGVEVTVEAVRVLRAVEEVFPRWRFQVEEHPAGAQCYLERGIDMPAETWAACERAEAIFLGAM